MSGRREETTMQNENQSPNLTERGKETINYATEKGSEWTDKAMEKGKETIHDTRETVADAVRPCDKKEKSPDLVDKGMETIDIAAETGKEWVNTATEKGKEVLHDTRETVAKTVRPGDQKDQEESPSLVERGKQMMNDATEQSKEVIHDTRETVADAVEPEDTKRAREEANKSMLEKGKDYVNSAADAISNMLSTDQKEGDKNDNDKQ